jgi:hypothetical protein
VRRARAFLAVCALSLAALFPATHLRAAGGEEDWVLLRIHQAGGDITLEAPKALVKTMAQRPTGATVPLGHFQGKPLRMSADRLLRMLRDVPTGSKESLLFTRQTDQGPMAFYARTVSRKAPARDGTPMLLAFDMVRQGASPVNLVLPLVGAATLGNTVMKAAGFQADSDLGPLFEQGLESARQVGTGPVLRATSSDAKITVGLR